MRDKTWGSRSLRGSSRLIVTASLAGAVALIGALAIPAAADMWFDDFTDGNAEDGTPLEWGFNPLFSGAYDASSGDFYLAGLDLQNGITGGQVANDDETLAANAVAGDDFLAFAGTASVRIRARMDGPGTIGASLFGNPSVPNGYTAMVENIGGLFIVAFDMELGGQVFLETGNLELDPDEEITDVFLQYDASPQPDVNGTLMALTVWTPGEVPPAEPQLTTVVDDPAILAKLPFEGLSGIAFNEDVAEGFEGEGTGTFHWAMASSTPLVNGDVNGDGQVNGLDVDPFVDALLNGPYHPLADMNSDDQVNGLDVDPFVAAVVSGGVAPIPEPSTLLLSLFALGISGIWRRRLS